MYDMYPERWTGEDDRPTRTVAERPRRRLRKPSKPEPQIIRVRQERAAS